MEEAEEAKFGLFMQIINCVIRYLTSAQSFSIFIPAIFAPAID